MTTEPGPLVGSIVDLEVGPVAHGGHCVARLEGRVVFVRHALPGELVRAKITEGGDRSRFLRADAVEVVRASVDRVDPPCPASGPGGCGGCDWQHATPSAQLALKTTVVREQLRRLGGLEGGVADVNVEALPGPDGVAEGLGWRTRVQLGVDPEGRLGFRRHRSHDIVAVPQCPITHADAAAAGHLAQRWPGVSAVEVAAPAGGDQRLVVVTPDPAAVRRTKIPPVDASVAVLPAAGSGTGPLPLTRVRGRTWVREVVRVGAWRHEFRITGAGFWQVHPAAAATLAATVLDQLAPRPGERALDLYCGVGLFAAAIADRVGPSGQVAAVEGDPRAVSDARRNLHELPNVSLHQGTVARVLPTALEALRSGRADIVVLDPPRVGAGHAVIEALCAAGPRAICYVACDPAALARDLRTATGLGYELSALRAFDAFPMTHHVECVALLTRPA